LLGELQTELVDECGRRNVALLLSAEESLPTANVDAVQLAVAVKALLTNSLEAIGRDGRIDVTAALAGDGTSLRIVVEDDGPGIPAEVRPHVFDPFYSGREAGRGLGFGLSKCWRIVTEHGGSVTIEPREGQGTAVVIELPRDAPAGS
jgi:signal transduction histidine kinase